MINKLATVTNAIDLLTTIVQTPPAGVGRIDRESCITHWNDELRTGYLRYLTINISCRNFGEIRCSCQVAYIAKKFDVFRMTPVALLPGLIVVGDMPCVDLLLQIIANLQQITITRRQVADDGLYPVPERRCVEFDGGQKFCLNEVAKGGIDSQPAAR